MATAKKLPHTVNERFGSTDRYSKEDVKTLLQEAILQAKPFYDGRTLYRIEDVVLNVTEVEQALAAGEVTGYEVTPSRCELRMEVAGTSGDMKEHKLSAVVYMSMDHRLYVTDIRDKPIPQRGS